MSIVENWKKELEKISQKEKIKTLSGFFKTGEGEYGNGDIFIGITVPENRTVAKKYFNATFDDIKILLSDPIHEFRLSALLALVEKFKKEKSDEGKREIIDFYLSNTENINNWDLVDLSAPYILGNYLKDKPHDILLQLSESTNFWSQRIAIVSTWTIIRTGCTDTTFRLAERYLSHSEPLIHKATGWMLREAGKKDIGRLHSFLEKYAAQMPRTMLSYAIEKMTPIERAHYRSLK